MAEPPANAAMRRARKAIRLKQLDYSQPGAYFVTVCVQGRGCLFGAVRDDQLIANAAGRMVEDWWSKLPSKFPEVEVDLHVVMPNHFHGIVVVVGADPCVRPGPITHPTPGAHMGAPLPTIVQWFKTMTTNSYIRGVKQSGWEPFPGKLWQRSYYEHIIRDERELNLIREYVLNNPLQWALDRENPEARHGVCDEKHTGIFGKNCP